MNTSSQPNIIAIDLETTGLQEGFNEIFEIACLAINNKFEILDSFRSYMRINHPERYTEQAQKITKISPQFLETQPDRNVIRNSLLNWIHIIYEKNSNNKLIAMGHNYINFDKKFIEHFLTPDAYSYYFNTDVDVDLMDLSRKYNNLAKCNKIPYPPTKNQKLETLCEFCNITIDNAHNALHDIVAAVECYKRIYNFIENSYVNDKI